MLTSFVLIDYVVCLAENWIMHFPTRSASSGGMVMLTPQPIRSQYLATFKRLGHASLMRRDWLPDVAISRPPAVAIRGQAWKRHQPIKSARLDRRHQYHIRGRHEDVSAKWWPIRGSEEKSRTTNGHHQAERLGQVYGIYAEQVRITRLFFSVLLTL